MTTLEDFKFISPMPEEVVKKYDSILPNQIIDIWNNYGCGRFHQDYFRVVNPDDFVDFLDENFAGLGSVTVIMTTGMGDIIAWQEGHFMLLDYRHGLISLVGTTKLFLHLLTSTETEFFVEDLKWLPYPEASQKLGAPAYNECFGYVPILGAGGNESVDNLQKLDLFTHIQVITAFMGPLDTYKVSS